MFMLNVLSISWWYWLLSAVLLAVGVAGNVTGFLLAIALTIIQLIHFLIRERRIAAFTVQVRAAFLVLLLLALPEAMRWLYWLPAVGTWAQVIFGYCLLARTLSLLPWNRSRTFSLTLLRQTYFSAPVRGSILQGLPAE